MKTKHGAEKWKEVKFNFLYTGNYRLEVSNLGRLRAYNKFSNGDLLQGSTVNGYAIIRLKFFKPKDRKTKQQDDKMHAAIVELQQKISAMKLTLGNKKTGKQQAKKIQKQISETSALLKTERSDLRKQRQVSIRERTMYYHSLVHRLVAEYFCTPKSPKHTIVGHLDYEKMNNKATNLKWMTPEENFRHQLSSPYVIEEKKNRAGSKVPRNGKLTAEKVGEMKKLLNKGKSTKALAKKFKVTTTQVLRIKGGINWGKIEAAG